MPVSTAACWWLAGCLFIFFGPQQVETEGNDGVTNTEISLWPLSIDSSKTPAGVSGTERKKKKKKEIKGKTKAPLEFLDWQNCDRSKAVCVCRGQALRETLQMETICWRWSRLSSTFFCLSAAVRSPPLVFSGLLGAFVDSFLVLS